MLRVCFLVLLPLLLLAACAAEQAQAPAGPQMKVNGPAPAENTAAKESLSDCMHKPSLVAMWACASQGTPSP